MFSYVDPKSGLFPERIASLTQLNERTGSHIQLRAIARHQVDCQDKIDFDAWGITDVLAFLLRAILHNVTIFIIPLSWRVTLTK